MRVGSSRSKFEVLGTVAGLLARAFVASAFVGCSSQNGNDGTGGTAGTPAPTELPTATGCPTLPTGTSSTVASGTIMVSRSDQPVPVDIYLAPDAKSKPAPGGPIVLYYHASYEPEMSKEVQDGFTAANIQRVMDAGGVVAAFNHVACGSCQTTDDDWWYVEDDPVQDFVVACAIQQANIDTRHIHALGWSAGALHSMHIGFARANYMASIVSYSGGNPLATEAQDPTNHFSSILTYGDQGTERRHPRLQPEQPHLLLDLPADGLLHDDVPPSRRPRDRPDGRAAIARVLPGPSVQGVAGTVRERHSGGLPLVLRQHADLSAAWLPAGSASAGERAGRRACDLEVPTLDGRRAALMVARKAREAVCPRTKPAGS